MPVLAENRVSARTIRRGAASLELILVLPVLLLITIGVIEFGVMFANLQQVALASRVGAERASELATLPATTTGDPVPPEVIEAIEQQLLSSGIDWCHIRLEHNTADPLTQEVLESSQGSECGCEEFEVLPEEEIPAGRYVRLTLTVRLCEVLPHGVTLFGCSLVDSELAFHSTTVFRYEIATP